MTDNLIDQLETFLANGGDNNTFARLDAQGKIERREPLSDADMRALWGDAFVDDFWSQFAEVHKGITSE